MRRIAAVTGGRADYGILRPVLREIQRTPSLELRLVVSGMHLAAGYGDTEKAIEADGFAIAERVDVRLESDEPEGIARSIGTGVIGFGAALARIRPDLLLLVGDRFETFSAAVAALPFATPVAHVHGGEVTEGAIDEAMRHSITKMSHLHFASTHRYAERIVQLGEEPWRVTVSGAPALDEVRSTPRLGRDELAARIGLPLAPAPLLVTYHPVTLDHEETVGHARKLLDALERSGLPVVFTASNADTRGRAVMKEIEAFVARHLGRATLVPSLGTQAYFSLLEHAAAMIGNSSSGIVEAASFGLPVVDVGSRQKGRIRGRNVVSVPDDAEAIERAIRHAVAPAFRETLRGLENPYGDGRAAERIVRVLATVPLDRTLRIKRFHDVPGLAGPTGRGEHGSP